MSFGSRDGCDATDLRRLALVDAAGAILLLAVLHLCPTPAVAQSAQTIAPEGYVDLDGIWPSPARVEVCWEPASEPFTTEKAWVKEAVEVHIEQNSSIRFQKWTECTEKDQDIRIRILDQRPQSAVGRQWARVAGVLQQDSWGRRIQVPTEMVLNFKFLAAYSTFCRPEREHCIRAIAVHEFLHALGFLHEQLNPKATDECKERFAHMADFPGFRPLWTNYDPDSHMNYCANMFRKPIQLSKGDIHILDTFYVTQ
jgi:hypothetical protein